MRFSSTDPGLIVSGLGHAALLIAILVSFSDAERFRDAQESIPIEMVTNQQFAQIMKGVKTAKQVKPKPERVDKIADIAETHKRPALAEAKMDVPSPPPRQRPVDDPGEGESRPVPVPPAPPPRPADLPKAETKAVPPPKTAAEAVTRRKPPPRPEHQRKKAVVSPPLPPPRPVEKTHTKPAHRFELDQIAKLIATSKPKSGEKTAERQPRLNLAEVSRLLSSDPPQERASTGRELSRVASLGSPTASAPKMSPSLWGQLDGLIVEQYKRCWTYLGLNSGEEYIPEIKVEFTPDGALATKPILRNPPSDPSLLGLAESAMRAVEECNPLKIPPQYAPYYDQWKSRIVRFDPKEMAG